MMKRSAILVGCNYPDSGPEYQLRGCINDVNAMKLLLMSKFEFAETDIQVLTDDARSEVKPTGVNIMQALNMMVDNAAIGDVLYFYFSGHGTLINKPTDVSQWDKAIVPCDLNFITEVEFSELVRRLPVGATFTFLADSSSSGGLIHNAKEQIGPSTITTTTQTSNARKSKFMPVEAIAEILKSKTGIESSDISTLMYAAFGDKASIKFRPQAIEHSNLLVQFGPYGGILLSACQANEVALERDVGGTIYSEFSNAVQSLLKWEQSPLTHKELVIQARTRLEKESYIDFQHPCLYCGDEKVDLGFLQQPDNPPTPTPTPTA